jgi:integral membrane sensor domain MASE1
LSSLTNFTIGNVYIAQVTNSGASPESQEREFQFGDVEGDTADIVAAQSLAALNASNVVGNTIDTLAQVDSTATAVGTLTTNLAQKPTLAQILAGGDVDGRTLEETLKLLAAALAGKVTVATVGSVTTVTFRAVDDSKARITATTDVSGNRTAVTLDVTG